MIEKEPIKAKVILWENAMEMYQHIENLMEMDKKNKIEDILIKTNNPSTNELPDETISEPKVPLIETTDNSTTPYVEEVSGTCSSDQTSIPSVEEVIEEQSSSFIQCENEGTIVPKIEEICDAKV